MTAAQIKQLRDLLMEWADWSGARETLWAEDVGTTIIMVSLSHLIAADEERAK